ncbi:Protein SERAC1 [Bienertia sinuspersici]
MEQKSRFSDSLKGRSMLVAAIMDVVTSTCDSKGNVRFQSCLPANAEMRDIASAIQVIEGGLNLDDPHAEDDDGGKGLKGIGINVLGGTTVLGLSRTIGLADFADCDSVAIGKYASKNHVYQMRHEGYLADVNLSSSVVPGLWDDLHSQHVAVPFAAWALANWAMASEVNRLHIQELDQDGNAIMTALAAPERSVRWHGSLVARLLLEDDNVPLSDSVSDWSSCLLSTISQACTTDDRPLAMVALSAFLLSVEKSLGAKKVVMEKGLDLMRDIAKQTMYRKDIQEALAKALELICASEIHLSLEESLKWSGILLHWACGKISTESTRYSAIKILSSVLEDFGPSTVLISQGWLTILLNEVLDSSKTTSMKGNSLPKNDKVKTQIDQSNIQSGLQIVYQLACSVVNLAGKQLGIATDSGDSFPIADLLSQEPFAGPFKGLNKDQNPKCDAADSAVATLKAIKSLTEICSEDLVNQNKIIDLGVLCLLRCFLLRDDYESLAAIEAYDASRIREEPEQVGKVQDESKADENDQSKVRIPPSAHIRRHAARLLAVLSARPQVQKVIIADSTWCSWLEECANGNIPGCNDPKIQSYARATLLNVFYHEKQDSDSGKSGGAGSAIVNYNRVWPRYEDMLFLINPEAHHWKCPRKSKTESSSMHSDDGDDCINLSSSTEGHGDCSETKAPSIDIVFVHGLRGGPFKSWRISDDKASSTKSGLVEKIDQEAGKQGTFWPGEWLSADFPHARMFTLRYKTNLTQWSGASLPLQEVSSMLLEKLIAADIGSRPTVFVTHSMGGLVVKQLLHQAKAAKLDNLVNNTVGVVCSHIESSLSMTIKCSSII